MREDQLTEAVVQEMNGRIAHLTLNRPDKFNCISKSLLQGLLEGIDQAENKRGIRAIVLSSNGPHFCTGADLDEVREHSTSYEALDAFISFGHQVMQRLETSPLPVIAAVQGYCLAGGMELMMTADVVFAGSDARIGCQHSRYGLVPGWGGTQRLPRLVGLRRALELMYSARWLDAETAADWGLVNSAVNSATLISTALQFADELTQKNPQGIAAIKSLARQGATKPLEEALNLEQSVAVPILTSQNVAEGLQAFRERRPPRFKD